VHAVGIVAAAGSGLRLGADRPKALVPLCGRALVCWAVDTLRDGGVDQVIAAVPAHERAAFATVLPGEVRLVAGGATAVAPVLLGAWMVTGPLAPHWAARAGTPPALLHSAATATTSGASTSTASSAPVPGTVSGSLRDTSSGGAATIVFSGQVQGSTSEQLQLVLRGTPEDGGVSLSSGTVSFTPSGGATWSGPVTGLQGDAVFGRVSAAGSSYRVEVDVQPNASAGTFTGAVRIL